MKWHWASRCRQDSNRSCWCLRPHAHWCSLWWRLARCWPQLYRFSPGHSAEQMSLLGRTQANASCTIPSSLIQNDDPLVAVEASWWVWLRFYLSLVLKGWRKQNTAASEGEGNLYWVSIPRLQSVVAAGFAFDAFSPWRSAHCSNSCRLLQGEFLHWWLSWLVDLVE